MPSFAVLFDPSRMAIQPRPCPKCLGPMVLTHSSRRGSDSRCACFRAPIAITSIKVVTETYSMKWMFSGRKRVVELAPDISPDVFSRYKQRRLTATLE
jgi:hypothetical protein